MTRFAPTHKFRIRVAAALVSSVSFLAIERANAACDQAAPINNTQVNCSGTTTNANPPNGWGTGVETGDTINVQPGGSVTGASAGISVSTVTINNSGTLTGSDGIQVGNGSTINNDGTINSNGIGGIGISSTGDATITNSNTIQATKAGGIAIRGAAVTLTNGDGSGAGTISSNGQNGIAIQANTITVTGNTGTIEAGQGPGASGGIAIDASAAGGTASVTTSGSIQASSIAIVTDGLLTLDNTGTGSIASGGTFAVKSNNGDVSVNQSVTVGTTGTISAIDPNATAISAANGTATVANFGDGNDTGAIVGGKFAISAKAVNVTANTGAIAALATNGIAIQATAGDVSVNQSIATGTPTGTITATAAGGEAIRANLSSGTATVANFGDGTNTGVISANLFAIHAFAVNVTGNTGLIEATAAGTDAIIAGAGDANINNDLGGVIRANNGLGAEAIASQGNASVVNAGRIEASGTGGLGIGANESVSLSNSGTVTAGGSAVNGDTITITGNSGTISATDPTGIAVSAITSATVTNLTNGLITGPAGGISAGTATVLGNVIVTDNQGTIEAANNANTNVTGGIAINATGNADITNSNTIRANESGGIAIKAGGTATVNNSGQIFADGNAGQAIAATTANVTNSGTIELENLNAFAVKATNDATVTNSGTIFAANGNGSVAIQAGGTATIANAATGTISGNATAIDAQTVNINSNAGTIEATADQGNGGVGFAIFGDVINVTNSGTIRENGAGGRAISATAGANGIVTVNNLASGSILADGQLLAANNQSPMAIGGDTVNVTNAGKIEATNGVGIDADRFVTVLNKSGATISGGTTGISGSGSITNAGTISGGTASVAFTGTGTNTLILQTGSVLNGDANGSAASSTNQLVLQGHGTVTSNFNSFNTLDVQADTAWVWNTSATITGCPTTSCTTVTSGIFAVDGGLVSPTAVNSGGTLAGRGTLTGDVTNSGTIAPGAVTPFSTFTINGGVTFNPGSIYRVNVNAAGQNDKLVIGAAADLTGGSVSVMTQNGVLLGTPYTILTAPNNGLGGTQFSGVSGNFAFLKPTLTYDANDVFLTFAGAGANGTVGFVTAAQTRNQLAVATALDASPTNNSLVGKLLSLTIDGARAAFDALSGEIFGTVQNTQAQEGSFTRSGVLGRLRQAFYADAPGELGALGFAGPELAYAGDGSNAAYAASNANAAVGNAAYAADLNGRVPVKAPHSGTNNGSDLTFWAQGLGGWGHSDSDGNAASLKSRFGGFLSGADMRIGEAWRAGLVAGYTRTDLNVDARSSSGGIDSVTFGAYAGGKLGAFNVRGGATLSYDSIDTSRTIAFPGFTDSTHAHFHGSVGQLFGELGYGMGLGTFAVEPFAGLAYVHVQDGSFQESGGLAARSAISAHENLGYSTLGLRAATFIPLSNGTALVPRGSLQWQHAFGDVTPTTALAFQSTGTAFTVAGLPIARDSALVETGFDWRISPWTRLGAFYQGELAAHAQSHALKGAFTWDF